MRADPIAYSRAAAIGLSGLGVQLALAAMLLVYALFARDHSAMTAAFYVALGSIVWGGLALVFHQNKLERLEAIEQDALSESGGADASVFTNISDELRVAARRLAWMHRLFLPGLSLPLAAGFIGVGLLRFFSGRPHLDETEFVAPEMTGWAIAVSLAIAVVGFVFARFVAGMAKQPEWSNLRAGASAVVGAALVGLALAIAHFIEFLGNDVALRYLHVAIPVFMIALGGEILFNFVLNLYRPRRPGETPRPAFDSRILGFVAAPDRLAESLGEAISYQFGFDVTESWFYRLLSRTAVLLVGTGLIVLWGLSSLAVVGPDERGLVLRFGSLQREVASGLHLKMPWPLETVERYPALAVTTLEIGSPAPDETQPILWTNRHIEAGRAEVPFIVQPTATLGDVRARDLAVAVVEAPLQFTVSDLSAFERLAQDGAREPLLRAVASRALMQKLSTLSVDEIVGDGRRNATPALRAAVEREFEAMNAGVEVLFMGVTSAHPPRDEDVAKSFENVVIAEQRRESLVERSEAYRVRRLTEVAGDAQLAQEILRELDALERMTDAGAEPERITEQELRVEALLARAGGQAADTILAARADRWERHMGERGRAVRHEGLVQAYRAAPQVFKADAYFAALREMAADARVYITATPAEIVWKLEDLEAIGGLPTPAAQPKEN